MDFYYQGQLRLQLFGVSPNVTATVFVFMLFLALGGLAFARERIPGKRWLWVGIPGYLLCLLLLEALLLTYSRGGMVALTAGLLLLVWKEWRLLLPLLVPALLLLAFTPSGLNRVKDVGNFQDRSVGNRLILWYHGSGMVLDYWRKGVRTEACGTHYTRWYKPLKQKVEGYYGMVNGYLTYMGNNGLPKAFLVFWGMFFLVCCALDLGYLRGVPFYRCLGAGMISMAVCEIFSTMFIFPPIYWCMRVSGILALGGALWVHRGVLRRQAGALAALGKRGAALAGASAGLALLPLLVVVVMGSFARREQYYRRTTGTLSLDGKEMTYQRFTANAPNGRWILHLAGDVQEEARTRILPLCQEGYGIFAVEDTEKWNSEEIARRLPLLLQRREEDTPFSVLMLSGSLPSNSAFRYFCTNRPEEIKALVLWEPIWQHPMEEHSLESMNIPEGCHVLFLEDEEWGHAMGEAYRETQREGGAILVPTGDELPQALGTALGKDIPQVPSP
ncbi:MAG: O-antigen ligase family protein [Oligosphaeraceae bacterium]